MKITVDNDSTDESILVEFKPNTTEGEPVWLNPGESITYDEGIVPGSVLNVQRMNPYVVEPAKGEADPNMGQAEEPNSTDPNRNLVGTADKVDSVLGDQDKDHA